MDVTTITMPSAEAKNRLKAYRRQLHRKADAEYEAIAKGYEELAKGHALIDLERVMQACPRDAKGRPRLAIARSDRREAHYWRDSGRDVFSTEVKTSRWGRGRPGRDMRIRVAVPLPSGTSPDEGYALVPMVSADALASAGNPALEYCCTLWEVEQWRDVPRQAIPDRDPFLLKHLGGALYVVLAEWDLTELERAVMAGRRRAE